MAAKERKLLLHEKVEVRSLDDGFLGSWHPGVVIRCEELVRAVKYDHILCDDDDDAKLVEDVKVTPAIDGVLDEEVKRPGEYRGLIRPCPKSPTLGAEGATPTLGAEGAWLLHYGVCVDLFLDDAWWEGVVLDHEDGCDRRRIFFPDLGDEVEGKVDDLRLSKDWDEVTQRWKSRGNWLFLELIEEQEKDWPLLVSVRQMWYEVRTKDKFEKVGEWTSSNREVWNELLQEVFRDNLKLAVEHLFANLSCKSAKQGQMSLKFLEKEFESILKSEGPFRSSVAAAAPVEEGIPRTDVNHESNDGVQIQGDRLCVSVRPEKEQVLSPNPVEDSGISSSSSDESPGLKLRRGKHKILTRNRMLKWQSAVPELVSGPKKCLDAIDHYKEYIPSKGIAPSELILDVSKHLLFLGWKIDFTRNGCGNTIRRRYTSPDGKRFPSLPGVFKKLDCDFESEHRSLQVSMHPNDAIANSVSSHEEAPSPSSKSQASSELSKSCITNEMIHIEPKHCPEAVEHYCSLGAKLRPAGLEGEKARQHLSSLGWSFYYHKKREGREMRYISPAGRMFPSLVGACRWCVKTGAHTSTDLSPATGRVVNRDFIDNDHGDFCTSKSQLAFVADDSTVSTPLLENGNTQLTDVPVSEGFVQSIKGEVQKTRMSRRKRRKLESDCLEVSLLSPNRGRKSKTRLRGDSNADSSTPVRRSSKRVRERDASSSQLAPRTILSWLIDNNVVSLGEKVHYCSSKKRPRMAGQISREGIKCSCCGGIFTLSNFETHAGGSDRRPSANIFLEDGRSLIECQLELKLRNSRRNSKLERQLKATQHSRISDNICSVCHYGGELVLCDLCPSSFHTQCVGLKDVPEGDWFCPSCCCQICKSNTGNRPAKDPSFRICYQCERRYHAECLTIEEDATGYWFCHDTCRQIFHGLRDILGVKVPVGTENMTWTLVKYMESDFSKNGAASNDEVLVESYSKLNVALSVMHECFEPVKEPRTRRDLMEDVIFSRRSDLNRLNFQGFYTVLLEKNDELVSAASVRIYGKTVAEVPLVATRFQFRRLGMCRILMNELEKQFTELGIERLVLPAIPTVLNTWINSFGFSKMDESERLNFLVYTFLDFQGTVFCQKMLNINLSMILGLPAEKQTNYYADIEFDGNSAVSEVLERKLVEETDTTEQEMACNKTVADNGDAGCSTEKAIVVVDQPTVPDYSSLHPALDYPLLSTSSGTQSESSTQVTLKCYKRRKVSAC
ncbi:uncharacterized protein LOC121787416 [Salvia splendens]|uniref:uncharacterized protein LOC121787416 n=1 Tax=Salvia splendens TaxID=180675 RepID=UPI001C25B3AE|nr:uncharacterized protein LOC121787416 [Salvia splendens]